MKVRTVKGPVLITNRYLHCKIGDIRIVMVLTRPDLERQLVIFEQSNQNWAIIFNDSPPREFSLFLKNNSPRLSIREYKFPHPHLFIFPTAMNRNPRILRESWPEIKQLISARKKGAKIIPLKTSSQIAINF